MNPNEQIASSVSSNVNFDADGKQHGHLALPSSRNDSAWGSIHVPITVIKNGEGPTVTLIGGSHGDEYEGPLTLLKLSSSITPDQISGRLILIPCLNAPAVDSACRLSPIDQLNMNRAFPGKADGSVTEKIAHFISENIISISDYVLDIHSGGKTLEFIPLAAVHFLADRDLQEKAEAAMIAFGAPNSLRMREMDDRGMLDTLVESTGKVFVTTEIGGGGSASRESLHITSVGCNNFLVHTGLLDKDIELCSTRMLEMPESDCFVVSHDHGMLELCATMGSAVYKGSVIAKIHNYKKCGGQAVEYTAERNGILMARHHPGIIKPGDCMAVIAEEVPR